MAENVTYPSNSKSGSPIGEIGVTLTILHFNDVYEIEARSDEPVGGAARYFRMFIIRHPMHII